MSSLYLSRQIPRSSTRKELYFDKILLSVFTGHCYLVNLLGIAVWGPPAYFLVEDKDTSEVEMNLGR